MITVVMDCSSHVNKFLSLIFLFIVAQIRFFLIFLLFTMRFTPHSIFERNKEFHVLHLIEFAIFLLPSPPFTSFLFVYFFIIFCHPTLTLEEWQWHWCEPTEYVLLDWSCHSWIRGNAQRLGTFFFFLFSHLLCHSKFNANISAIFLYLNMMIAVKQNDGTRKICVLIIEMYSQRSAKKMAMTTASNPTENLMDVQFLFIIWEAIFDLIENEDFVRNYSITLRIDLFLALWMIGIFIFNLNHTFSVQ